MSYVVCSHGKPVAVAASLALARGFAESKVPGYLRASWTASGKLVLPDRRWVGLEVIEVGSCEV